MKTIFCLDDWVSTSVLYFYCYWEPETQLQKELFNYPEEEREEEKEIEITLLSVNCNGIIYDTKLSFCFVVTRSRGGHGFVILTIGMSGPGLDNDLCLNFDSSILKV